MTSVEIRKKIVIIIVIIIIKLIDWLLYGTSAKRSY